MKKSIPTFARLSAFGRQNADVLSILSFFVFIASILSYLRFSNFYATNWDLGINMQMLWSTTHGRLLYESGDFVSIGVRSFLLVHSTYIALPISLLYNLLPYPTTLFVIQSASVAASGYVVFLITSDKTNKRVYPLLAMVIFLSSFTVISSLLYDYHWEALLPLETLSLFYLWGKGNYKLSIVPFFIGCCTLEVFPFLTTGVALYYLSVYVPDRSSHRSFRALFDRKVLMSLLLVGASVVAYGIIRVLQYYLLPIVFGQQHVFPRGYVGGSFTFLFGVLHPTFGHAEVVYWLLIYASFAFIPFLHPRHLLMQLPWLLATITIFPATLAGFNGFGIQYPLIGLPAIGVGLAHGFRVLESHEKTIRNGFSEYVGAINHFQEAIIPKSMDFFIPALVAYYLIFLILFFTLFSPRMLLSNHGALREYYSYLLAIPVAVFIVCIGTALITRRVRYISRSARKFLRKMFHFWNSGRAESRFRIILSVLVISLFVFNVLLSPLNPGNDIVSNSTFGGYSFSAKLSNLSADISEQLSHVPIDATILASDNLFPFVANRLHSFPLPYTNVTEPYLPFNSSNLPDYVMLDTSMMYAPGYIMSDVFNSSIYGIRYFTYVAGYPGSVYLFQKGYNGTTKNYRTGNFPTSFYIQPSRLSTVEAGSGLLVSDADSMFGKVISSYGVTNLTNRNAVIWFGPYEVFPAGNYTVTFSLKGAMYNQLTNSGTSLFTIDASSLLGNSNAFISSQIDSSNLSVGTWTNITYHISLPIPYPAVEFRGYLSGNNDVANGYIILNYIHIERT